MARRIFSWLPALLLFSACIPSFEEAECYSDIDCPGGLVCRETVCTRSEQPDSGVPPRDAGVVDATVLDATPSDASGADASRPDALPDAGTMDSGDRPDAEADAGPMDVGPMDVGSANDAAAPDADVRLSLTPSPVDFGERFVGCLGLPARATLRNVGGDPANVTSVGFVAGTTAELQVTPLPTPFVLASGLTRDVELTYAPAASGVDSGRLRVEADGAAPVEIDVLARGVVGQTHQDTFTQVGGPLDLLFVIDNSILMSGFQDMLADNLIFLFLELGYQGWDYQIGVTTTDVTGGGAAGRLVGTPTFLTPQTVNVEQTLGQRVRVGDTGANVEQGLEAGRLALSAPLVTGANAGFLRANAALMIVVLSDEDDQSPMNVSAYSTFFDGLKGAGNGNRVGMNAIVSNVTFCSLPGGLTAEYAGRYIGAVGLVGGAVSHICGGDWTDALTTFPPITRNPRFVLSNPPMQGTLQVRVGGALVPSNGGANWTFDAAINAIVFSAAATPENGTMIQVDYDVAC